MIFSYRPAVLAPPDRGDFLIVYRPEIPITIVGPIGFMTITGLVDTGSDNTILPRSVADSLGIPLRDTMGPPPAVFGGGHVKLQLGEVVLRLDSDGEQIEWPTTVYFFAFADVDEETAILGHLGFLDYFKSIFDGKNAELTLLPNDELPVLN